MIIKALTIENFKSIREPVRVEFKPITLLFGPNSAGKSTIIQAIHYLREIFERKNFDPDATIAGGDFIDLGGFRNFVHNRDLHLPIRFRIELDLSKNDIPEYLWPGTDETNRLSSLITGIQYKEECWNYSEIVETAWVDITIAWSFMFQRPQIIQYETGINGHFFAQITASEDGKRVRISRINFNHPSFPVDDPESFDDDIRPGSFIKLLYDIVINEEVVGKGEEIELGLKRLRSAIPELGSPLIIYETCIADPMARTGEETNEKTVLHLSAILSQLLVGPAELVKDTLLDFRYIGPIRKIPPRGYVPMKSPVESRWADGMAAWDRLYLREESFSKRVSDWLLKEKRLNSGYWLKMRTYREVDSDNSLAVSLITGNILDDELSSSVFAKIQEKRELQLVEMRNGLAVALQDIGVGISQMIPVVVAALDEKASLVMIEQPELHIHPKLQVNLGELFASQIQDAPDGNQFFLIETHSEHLLLRLLKKIRQTTENEIEPDIAPLSPEQLSIMYIQQTPEGTKLQRLAVSADGDSLGEWPQGFFEERAGELF